MRRRNRPAAERLVRAERLSEPEAFARLVEKCRNAVRSYLGRVSLREAAREIGMSPTGLRKFADGGEPYAPTVHKLREWMQRRRDTEGGGMTGNDALSEVVAAETEMFADVLNELFLGVLATVSGGASYGDAALLLSRGVSRKLLDAFNSVHASGLRLDTRAAGIAEAIELLFVQDRPALGPYDFPSELAVLVVAREAINPLLQRVRAGVYASAGDVLSSALCALEWAENDPAAKTRLLKHAIEAGDLDAEQDQLIPAEEVFTRARLRIALDAER